MLLPLYRALQQRKNVCLKTFCKIFRAVNNKPQLEQRPIIRSSLVNIILLGDKIDVVVVNQNDQRKNVFKQMNLVKRTHLKLARVFSNSNSNNHNQSKRMLKLTEIVYGGKELFTLKDDDCIERMKQPSSNQ
jgi:CHAT domain-containing protein